MRFRMWLGILLVKQSDSSGLLFKILDLISPRKLAKVLIPGMISIPLSRTLSQVRQLSVSTNIWTPLAFLWISDHDGHCCGSQASQVGETMNCLKLSWNDTNPQTCSRTQATLHTLLHTIYIPPPQVHLYTEWDTYWRTFLCTYPNTLKHTYSQVGHSHLYTSSWTHMYLFTSTLIYTYTCIHNHR